MPEFLTPATVGLLTPGCHTGSGLTRERAPKPEHTRFLCLLALGMVLCDGARHSALAAESLPPIPESSFTWWGYFQALGFMALLVLALWAGLWALRRTGHLRGLNLPGGLPRGALRMEAQMALGPRKAVMVVRFLNKHLVLGVTDQRISLLTELEVSDESTPPFQQCMDNAARSPQGADMPDAASGSESSLAEPVQPAAPSHHAR